MATKSWRDPGALRFVQIAMAGGLWTANHSLMVDAEFWRRIANGRAGQGLDDQWTRHAMAVFEAATRAAYATGEPGFVNGDLLEDHRSGSAWRKPVCRDGSDLRRRRYRAEDAVALLAELTMLSLSCARRRRHPPREIGQAHRAGAGLAGGFGQHGAGQAPRLMPRFYCMWM